ncbi:MAG: hypothetical protein A3F72_15040 [Bacteroidetes bacterium RIFCSPLOWO2_12_FULL_35_15]|nr:MAG: hypothetical protein A3F72_15040 [Bacteroidetes bacterium RIFCSPLOWO2_12_FULL_35_15]
MNSNTTLLSNDAAEIIVVERNILFWKYHEENYVSKKDFLEMLSVTRVYVEKFGKCYFIVEAPVSMNFDIETWRYVSETNYEDEIALATAMYTTGIQHNMMGKSYERKVTPQVPFKIFNNFNDSLNWIKAIAPHQK